MKLATIGNGKAVHIHLSHTYPGYARADGTTVTENTYENTECGALNLGSNFGRNTANNWSVSEGEMSDVTCKRCLAAWNTSARIANREARATETAMKAREEAGEKVSYPVERNTVTTVEELAALPVGSVVVSDDYRYSMPYINYPVAFQRLYDGAWHRGGRSSDTHPDHIVPARVIYRGQA